MKYTQDQLKKQVFLLVTKSLTEGLTEEEKKEYNRLKNILGEGEGKMWRPPNWDVEKIKAKLPIFSDKDGKALYSSYDTALVEAGADAMLTAVLEWIKGSSKEDKVVVFTDGKLYTTTIKMFDEFFEYPKEELDEEISEGLGSVWSAYCPKCKEKSMSVVRPGKVQCDNCG